MPGMKMNEMSCRKERKNSANQFLFKELPLALEKKRMIIIINILSDKVHARYKVLCNTPYSKMAANKLFFSLHVY